MTDPQGIGSIPVHWRSARSACRALRGVLLAVALAASTASASAGQLRELAREATPLVLKDGRIAHVAIWAVPFRPGASDLDPEVKAELAGLVETLATDCFLTAQAIGHVEPEAAKAGETLTAHRLARARADRIQQAMVERGLQASAIASVWDWQFLVKEPRVTVWVFRLHEGEDCQGKRLERPAPAALSPPGARELPVRSAAAPPAGERPAADRSAPASPTAAAETSKPAAAAAQSGRPPGPAATPGEGAGRSETPAPMPGSTPPPRPLVAARSVPAQAPSLPGASAAAEEALAGPVLGQEEAAGSSRPPAATVPTTQAEAQPSGPGKGDKVAAANGSQAPPQRTATRTDAEAAQPAPVAALDPGEVRAPSSVEIVFDVNSSYFPKGATAELRRFLKALPAGGAVRLQIVGAVGGVDVKEASGAAGARYNRWLAERRVGRVVEWLKENAGGRRLEIATSFAEDDPSRRVTIRLETGG